MLSALLCDPCCDKMIQRTQQPDLPRPAMQELGIRRWRFSCHLLCEHFREFREEEKRSGKILCACSIWSHESLGLRESAGYSIVESKSRISCLVPRQFSSIGFFTTWVHEESKISEFMTKLLWLIWWSQFWGLLTTCSRMNGTDIEHPPPPRGWISLCRPYLYIAGDFVRSPSPGGPIPVTVHYLLFRKYFSLFPTRSSLF